MELVSLNPDSDHWSPAAAPSPIVSKSNPLHPGLCSWASPIRSPPVWSKRLPGPAVISRDFHQIEFSLIEKLVELLRELAPGITRVAFISNPDNPATAL